MPIVKIEIWKGRNEETKEILIRNVTKAVSESINCPPEKVIVIIEDSPKANWGIGGVQASKF